MPILVFSHVKGGELPVSWGVSPDSECKVTVEVRQPKQSQPEKGKWARVAERMAKENYLDGELGERVEKNVRQFRDNFVMKNPLSKNSRD